jgi:hypothetical protein
MDGTEREGTTGYRTEGKVEMAREKRGGQKREGTSGDWTEGIRESETEECQSQRGTLREWT